VTGLVSKAHSHTLVSTRSIDALQFEYFDALTHNVTQAVDLDGSGSIGLPEFISLIADPEGPLGVALAGLFLLRGRVSTRPHTVFWAC
jgi:hypothetical protein